jgi:two-component system sensor histidine kinase/response regulator
MRSILIVDDVPANLKVVTEELEARGYTALVARDGQEALERAEYVRPDLILLDIMMPGMDGLETCRRLKQNEATRDIPIIFMTAMTTTADKIKGFRAGAVDYVTKPLNPEEVLARIDIHLTLYALRQQLAQQNRQLHQEIAAREQMQAALLRSNTELEQLAYVASHDMQEPLRMIASYLQLVAQRYHDKLDDDGREFIGYAVDGAKRMQALINDMLAYSRVGTKARSFQPVSTARLVDTAITFLGVAVQESGAQIERGELPSVHGDAMQLAQLFQNLLANAIKFRGSAAPQVRVDCQAQGEDWCFTVRDNGIGIAPEYFQRIFALFQRLHSQRKYPGTGIGLALCKKIVERHGGHIGVESTPGEGSVFTFTLPRLPGGPTEP